MAWPRLGDTVARLQHLVAACVPDVRPERQPCGVLDETVTTAELLTAWREATRAAELAERLSALAAETADRADTNAQASEEIADLAEQAAAAATRAAERARAAAGQAREAARAVREERLVEATASEAQARAVEFDARDRYHDAEAEARHKLDGGPSR